MPNYLQMSKQQQVVALLALDWSYRRIEAETGVRRETVSRYDRTHRANAANVFPGSAPAATDAPEGARAADDPNAAKVFAGSPPNAATVFPGSGTPLPRPRRAAAAYRTAITEKRDDDSHSRPVGSECAVARASKTLATKAHDSASRALRYSASGHAKS